MDLTAAFYDRMAGDWTLAALLALYHGAPAVLTSDPAPGDAALPYIVSAGEIAQRAFDSKTTRGREIWRDVRCYAPVDGDPSTVEAMAERVRALFHRHKLAVDGAQTWVAEAGGPVAADEDDAYARIVTIRLVLVEE
jgi:hypothetical protein